MGQRFPAIIVILIISGLLVTGANSPANASANLHLTGLALHQETGRNIYVGGLYFDRYGPKPDDFVDASAPWLMEYRVVARRTSIRSLLGGILLQSEVATGRAPDSVTADFATRILSIVKSNLYAGDSFEIMLNAQEETIAYLNGLELDVTLLDNGELVEVSVVQASGYGILDKAAVKAAQEALSSGELTPIDPVAIAEFSRGEDGNLVIPVPVTFMLTE